MSEGTEKPVAEMPPAGRRAVAGVGQDPAQRPPADRGRDPVHLRDVAEAVLVGVAGLQPRHVFAEQTGASEPKPRQLMVHIL